MEVLLQMLVWYVSGTFCQPRTFDLIIVPRNVSDSEYYMWSLLRQILDVRYLKMVLSGIIRQHLSYYDV